MRDEKISEVRFRFFDTGGKGDRFTAVYMDEHRIDERGEKLFSCFGMNETPTHPCYGIGMHSECSLGKHLGKRIAFVDLPDECQKVIRRLAGLTV